MLTSDGCLGGTQSTPGRSIHRRRSKVGNNYAIRMRIHYRLAIKFYNFQMGKGSAVSLIWKLSGNLPHRGKGNRFGDGAEWKLMTTCVKRWQHQHIFGWWQQSPHRTLPMFFHRNYSLNPRPPGLAVPSPRRTKNLCKWKYLMAFERTQYIHTCVMAKKVHFPRKFSMYGR